MHITKAYYSCDCGLAIAVERDGTNCFKSLILNHLKHQESKHIPHDAGIKIYALNPKGQEMMTYHRFHCVLHLQSWLKEMALK